MFENYHDSPSLGQIERFLREGDSLLLEGLWNSPKALISILAAKATGKHILILTGASTEETRLYHDFKYFSDLPVIDFPAWETLPSESIPPSPDIVGDRYTALNALQGSSQPHIVITGLQAVLQKLLLPKRFSELHFQCKTGQPLNFQDTIERLVKMGYQRKNVAADKGEFAVRGGIIDVFPVSSPDPYRLEFWGDELESLRTYDPVGQKSIQVVESLQIVPGQELELIQKETQLCSVLDYLGPNTLIVFDDLLNLEDRYTSLLQITSAGPQFFSIKEFLDDTEKFQKLYLSKEPIETLSDIRFLNKPPSGYYSEAAPPIALQFQLFNRDLEATRLPSPFRPLPEEDEDVLAGLKTLPKDYRIQFLFETEAEEAKLKKQLDELHLHGHFELGYLSSGFVLSDANLVIFPMTELTRRYKIRRQKQRSTYHTTYVESNDLAVGDLVVHYNHGIGKFLGMEKKPNNQGVLSEFYLVEYAEAGKLYVPIQQAYLISKYIGGGEEMPRLHTIGGTRWKKTREQTQSAILGYASELLNLYAHRELKGGFTFKEDSPDMEDFEEDFPFIETEDQLAAIRDIKIDMVSPKAMDRLVCGDVGYGKTEVAMRAAFKAVVDGGKQVAVLVPTTVLAMQHFDNFVERMRNFPVNVAVLSRFRSAKEIRESIKGIQEGSIDIVIGTHRLISKDIQFKDLGLVIIDEEQRFGVKAKEHLKKLKSGVDCLTLSATPIPRTLYMSIVGARDMSIISSPPQDRLPIKTVIAEPDDQLMKTAILRELARDGQIYFIHNRVETIYDVSAKIKGFAPNARIVTGHGQMHADELDSIFHAFRNGHADILVATTIVENGIDVPNANTILIDRADRFGLADLYQLRGRVGRWNRRAYAYFLVPRLRSLPELSRKRLDALAESSGYGGGMKLAMRDLEIRGAGNMLGTEQSGHVSSVGFHLYCKMLKRTIKTLQGKLPQLVTDVKIEFPVDARIPDTYIEDVSLRMEIYQRFGESLSLEEVRDIWSEVKDRFGVPPEPAEWLYELTSLKVFAQLNGYTLIQKEKLSVRTERIKGKETVKGTLLIPSFKMPSDVSSKIIPLLAGKK